MPWLLGLLAAFTITGPQFTYGPSPPPYGPTIKQDIALANHVWWTPCRGEWTFHWEQLGDYTNDQPHAAGYATYVGAEPPFTDCHVAVDPDGLSPLGVCTVILHEVGHLAGQPHNSNPNKVMFPGLTHIDRRCERLWRRK